LQKFCIIFPSFHQLNFYKRILNMTAPVFNFLMTNKLQKSHGNNMNSINHFVHNQEHFIQLIPEITTNQRIKPRNLNNQVFKIKYKYFTFVNELVTKLKQYFIYDSKISYARIFENVNKIQNNPNFNKYMNSIILFLVFHEIGIIDRIYINNNRSIESYFLLFKENFLLSCRKFIIYSSDRMNLENLSITPNSYSKNINEDFINLMEAALYIKIDQTNIISVINLFKKYSIQMNEIIIQIVDNILRPNNNENLYS